MTAPVYTRPVAVPATALTAGDRFLARRVIDALAPPDGPGDLIVAADRMEPFDDMAMVVELETGQVLEVDSIVWARIAGEPPAAPPRATFLQLADVRVLDMWGAELRLMFDHTAYLVGSCLLRPDYRDVDVRIVLPDELVDQLAAVVDLGRLHVALSVWGQKVTGLPIDCQVQSVTEGDAVPMEADHLIRPIGRVPGRLDGREWGGFVNRRQHLRFRFWRAAADPRVWAAISAVLLVTSSLLSAYAVYEIKQADCRQRTEGRAAARALAVAVVDELFIVPKPRPEAWPIIGMLVGLPFAQAFDRARQGTSASSTPAPATEPPEPAP